ncbi:Autophagy protein 7 [Actinomortierella ambigua]|uniref:Ubiquitin-like modifier-activating enzyme ATG7 n=1 Tax=Actinomortierella ambigua TaxID=1343610 RepID=A0A9P6QFL6_9FUNG|nr:Autophagy protein 7 [Actinomortierella ambigua]
MILQFHPWASAVEAPFWQTLTQHKMDIFKLDDSPKDIAGYYSSGQQVRVPGQDTTVALPARLCLGTDAFLALNEGHGPVYKNPAFTYPAPGVLKNTNTIEDFKSFDKKVLFDAVVQQIWEDIVSGRALTSPELLNRFLLVTFADLKKFKFYYWFAFPALLADPVWNIAEGHPLSQLDAVWTTDEVESFRQNVDQYRQRHAPGQSGFFLVKKTPTGVEVGPLDQWASFFSGVPEEERTVGFADPSSLDHNPGWPLRNLLALLQYQFNVSRIKILCFREVPGKQDISASKIFMAELASAAAPLTACPKAVGWEKNAQGKLGPRLADLAPLMDPSRLADTAVDLNLKLMRWRLLPELQLEKVQSTRCLLLGAGTLGCYVARSLLGWGVRHITFVDSAKVSFSNPVRQPLFDFVDCLEGGKDKATTAAANLKRVYPGVTAEGISMMIPMPGHPVPSHGVEKAQQDVSRLVELFENHDAIFLLMDSRESRWLPTLLGASMNKVVINAALGFDTYLVMRHGIGQDTANAGTRKSAPLGCYFCNDVVAPTDSLSDRTLDQQCTVTRPGLSAMASAMAVELMVSLLHHPEGPRAPADTSNPDRDSQDAWQERTSTVLGVLPHQIRGFLGRYQNLLISGQAYDRCTACSDAILDAYEKEGFGFLYKVFADAQHLEDVSGLTRLKEESENLEMEWDEDEDEDDDFEM